MNSYYEIDQSAVGDERRRVAERTLARVCDDLRLSLSALRWFSEETANDQEYVAKWGAHPSDRLTIDPPGVLEGRTTFDDNVTVWLRAGAALSELPVTVAHEAAHIAVRAERGPAWSPSERRRQEHMAEAFAATYREEGPS